MKVEILEGCLTQEHKKMGLRLEESGDFLQLVTNLHVVVARFNSKTATIPAIMIAADEYCREQKKATGTGYGTGIDSFQFYSCKVEGVGNIKAISSHTSKSKFRVVVDDAEENSVFEGTLAELVERLKEGK